MLEIIQYCWSKEINFGAPDIGMAWTYFKVGAEDLAPFEQCAMTKGKVDFVDWDSGVVTTDQNEMLIRG